MTIELFVMPMSPRAFKVTVLANYLGLDHVIRPVDVLKGEMSSPAYLALNPNARMPTMKDGDFTLWEANAIMQYLANRKPESGLFPQDERRRLDIVRWQFWELAHWDAPAGLISFENIVKGFINMGPPDKAVLAQAEAAMHRSAKVLDAHLRGKNYVSGDSLTIADFCLGAWLNATDMAKLPVQPYSEIARWYKSLAALPAWKETLGQSGM